MIVIVNSWMLYRKDACNLHLSQSEVSSLASFKLKVAFSLVQSGKATGELERGRPSPTNCSSKNPKWEGQVKPFLKNQ